MNIKITDKLIKMEVYIKDLKKIKPYSYKKYLSDNITKYAIERLIQLVIDLALDINNIIIKNEGYYPASDYYNSFIKLVEIGVLSEKFAYKIAPSTGIRNRLVHEYEKVNDKIIFENIEKTCDYYIQYMKYMNKYINN